MLKVLPILVALLLLCSCSKEYIQERTKASIDDKINIVKEDMAREINKAVQNAVDNSIESAKYSIESKLDPRLDEIRKGMNGVKEIVSVYYKVNKKFPKPEKLEEFLDKKLEDLKISYILSEDELSATIEYIGEEYTKEKIPSILIDSNTQ